MKVSEYLKERKQLIVDPKNWTKGELARDVFGREVPVNDRSAVCYCAMGALQRGVVFYDDAFPVFFQARKRLESVVENISIYNDTHTHSEVMQKWDEAIVLAEADEENL